MPLSFEQVQKAHELARTSDPFFADMDLGSFARYANQTLQTDDFSAGDTTKLGGLVKRASTGIDKALAPLSEPLGRAGRSVGEVIGFPDVLEDVGKAIPRMGGEIGAVAAGTAAGGPIGLGAALAGILSAGAKGYTETGSPAVGAISGLSTGLVPGAANLGVKAAAKYVTKDMAKKGLSPLAQRGVEYAGAQVGAQVPIEVGNQLSSLVQGQGLQNPFTKENVVANIAGGLAFLPFDAPMLAKGYKLTSKGPEAANLVDLARGTETPIASRGDWLNVEDARRAVVDLSVSIDEVVEPLRAKENEVKTEEVTTKKVEEAVPDPTPELVVSLKPIEELANEAYVHFKAGMPVNPAPLSKKLGIPFSQATTVMQELSKRGLVMQGLNGKFALAQTDKTPATQNMVVKPPLETAPNSEYLSKVLNKLSDLGATDEQLTKVVELSQKMPEVSDVDIAREAAKRAVLEDVGQALGQPEFQRPNNFSTVKGVTTFFKSLYEQRGYDPAGIDRLSNIATKMAVALGQFDVKVVRGKDQDVNFFIPLTESPDGKMVVLAQNRSFDLTARDMAHTLWVVGHELTHAWGQDVKIGAGDPRANKVYADAYQTFKGYSPQELQDVFTTLHAAVFPKVVVSTPSVKGVGAADLPAIEMMYERRGKVYADGEAGVREFMGDVSGLLAMGASSPAGEKSFKNILEMLRFSEPRVQDFMFQMYTDIGAVLHGNETLLDALWHGDEATKRKHAAPMTEALKNVSSLMKERLAADTAKQYLSMVAANLERTPYSPPISYEDIKKVYAAADLLMWKGYDKHGVPETQNFPEFKELVKKGYEMMFEPSTWEKESGLRLGWLDYIKPMGQLVKDFPIMGPVFDLGTGFQNHATEIAKKLWEPFFKLDGSGKLDEEFVRQLTDPKSVIQRPLSEILLAQNEVQRFLDAEEFAQYAGHLSADNQALLKRGLSAISQTSVRAAIARLSGEVDKIKSTIAMKLVQKLGPTQKMDINGAKKLAEQVYVHTFENGPISPAVQQLPIAVLADLVDFSNSMKPKLEEVKLKLLGPDGTGKPWWTTEVRLGDYFLGWREGKRPFVKGFYTEKEALQYLQKLRARGIEPKKWDKRDRQNMAQNFDPDLLQRYAEMDKVAYEKMLASMDNLSPEEIAFMKDMFMPGEGAWRMITPPSMQERNLVGGREDLNMMAGMMHYIDSTSLGLAKQFIRAEAAIRLHTPEMRANPNIQNAARQYLNNIITPGGKEFQALKSLVFFQYMGLSPATWFTEPTQLAVAHVPYLVREGASMKEAYQLTAKAMSKAAKYAFDKVNLEKEEPVLAEALKRAANEGVVDQGFVQEITMTEDVNTINLRNLSRGNEFVNSLETAKKPGYWLMKLARQFYSVPAHLVTRSAFLSAFEFALARGKSKDESYSFAKDAVRSTAYTGGTAARPLVFSYMGRAQGVGGLMYALSSYTFNTIAYMGRLAKEAIGRSGLSDTERSAARRAVGLMLGTQVVLGGALGLPFAATAIALVEQLFPEAEVRKELREAIASLAGQDEQLGGMMADASLHGVLNLGPADVGARFQLGNVFGMNSYDGFSWQNVFGPAANMAANWTKAVSDASKGEFESAARRVSPTGLRGLVDLATNNWQVKDRLGNLVFDPTASETLARVAGFSPKRLSQYYEQQSILKRSEQIQGDRLNRFHRDLAERLLTGDTLGVRRDLIAMQHELEGYDARSGVRRVAELVQNMTEPADLYRSGRKVGVDDRASLAATYTQAPQKPELRRLQERKVVERSLGIPGAGVVSNQELTLAVMVDRLRAMNPSLTYQQARMMVMKQLRPSRELE